MRWYTSLQLRALLTYTSPTLDQFNFVSYLPFGASIRIRGVIARIAHAFPPRRLFSSGRLGPCSRPRRRPLPRSLAPWRRFSSLYILVRVRIRHRRVPCHRAEGSTTQVPHKYHFYAVPSYYIISSFWERCIKPLIQKSVEADFVQFLTSYF